MQALFGGAEVSEDKIPTPNSFSKMIEKISIEEEISPMEAIVTYCDENQLEIETISKLITGPLKEKIRVEAINRKMLKERITKRLPIKRKDD